MQEGRGAPLRHGSPDDGGGQPANDVEAALADIWSSVFGIERIGIHEPFADLGGHSLLAMQIVAKIRSLYQINFSLRDFFEAPRSLNWGRSSRKNLAELRPYGPTGAGAPFGPVTL